MKNQRKSRIRYTAIAAVACAAVAFAPSTASASVVDDDRGAVLTRINEVRSAAGACPLVIDEAVQQSSQAWSAGMASRGRLSHNALRPLGEGASGENVGMAQTPLAVFDRFTASPRHYQNMLNSRYDRVGIGIESVNGRSWVTLNFTASNLRGC